MLDYLKLNWKYLSGAALLHALFAGIFALSMVSMSRNPPPPRLAIQAVLVDPSALGAASRRQEQEERERAAQQRRQQEAQQQRQAQQEQARQQEQQRQLQEEQQRLKEQQLQEQRVQEQRQEQQRQAEQEKVRQQEQQQRQQAEARERQEAERKRQAELERQKKAEAERQRVAEIQRKQKEEAERRKAAEDARVLANREADLQRQLAEEEGLNQAVAGGELDAYINLIVQRIERNWNRPPSARPGLDCRIKVAQAPGGTVLSAQVTECNGDAAVKQSIEAAVMRSSPLPPPSNPRLFERNLLLVFKPRD